MIYNFHERNDMDTPQCLSADHEWKLLIRCENENNVAIGICIKCAKLSGGWANLYSAIKEKDYPDDFQKTGIKIMEKYASAIKNLKDK